MQSAPPARGAAGLQSEERRRCAEPSTIDPRRKLGKAPRRGKVLSIRRFSVSTRLHSLVPLAVLALAAGCDETLISISSDGRIEVAVSTNGSDPDNDGFSVTVDGGTASFVAPGGSVVLDSLDEGSHTVL